MSTPDQPTPRDDAAWAKTFEDDEHQCRAGNAATDMRDECATLERELTVAENWVEHHSQHADDLIGENVKLRAEVERLKTCGIVEIAASNSSVLDYCKHWEARAERAEAELATEQARLDYLALQMGTPRVADALNCDYSQCFPIRDAIDLAMKNETTP